MPKMREAEDFHVSSGVLFSPQKMFLRRRVPRGQLS